MTKEVKVKICVGTYSYIMGGSDLIKIKDELPESLRGKVSFEGATEIKGCDENSGAKPPFAEVNGKIIEKANKQKIITAIEQELK